MIQKKLVDEIFVNYFQLFIIEKYLKIRFKNRGSSHYVLSPRGQKIKNITKCEQNRLFLLTYLVLLLRRFSRKKRFTQYMIFLCVWLIF